MAEYLIDFGLEGEGALFYADRILGRSSVIIVDSDEDEADEVADIMKDHGGRVNVF